MLNNIMLKNILVATAASALSISILACGTTREAKWDDTAAAADPAPATADASAVVAEGDTAWESRTDQAQLELAISKWEEAAKTTKDAELFTKLARGHYFLADGFHALADNVEKRDHHYTTGLDWAERSLKISAPEFAAAMNNGGKFREAITKAPKDSVPAIYWYSTNMGKWASAKGFATILRYKDDIKAAMMHVKALDPNFFHAAPYRYFGAYEARTAGIAGGSLEKSEENFKKAVEIAPGYLGTKVLWAEYLCVKQGDAGKVTAKKLLDEVVAADASGIPEVQPENEIEQKKAKMLLAKLDDMF